MTGSSLLPLRRSPPPRIPSVVALVSSVILVSNGLIRGASAQVISVRAIRADVDHPLVGGIFGPGITASVPIGTPRLGLQLAVERLAGSGERFGLACSVISAAVCLPEPLRDRARATGGRIGFVLSPFGGQAVSLRLQGGVGVTRMVVETRGLESGGRLAASKYMWRPDVGAEVGWAPWSRLGLSLDIGASIGWQSPINHAADGYFPFEQRSRVSKVWLGVSWLRH